jgi:hypothetical protein
LLGRGRDWFARAARGVIGNMISQICVFGNTSNSAYDILDRSFATDMKAKEFKERYTPAFLIRRGRLFSVRAAAQLVQ